MKINVQELQNLADLHAAGALSDREFAYARSVILGSADANPAPAASAQPATAPQSSAPAPGGNYPPPFPTPPSYAVNASAPQPSSPAASALGGNYPPSLPAQPNYVVSASVPQRRSAAAVLTFILGQLSWFVSLSFSRYGRTTWAVIDDPETRMWIALSLAFAAWISFWQASKARRAGYSGYALASAGIGATLPMIAIGLGILFML